MPFEKKYTTRSYRFGDCFSGSCYFGILLYVPRSRVQGLVSLALRFPFVDVETYTNSNLETKLNLAHGIDEHTVVAKSD